MKNLEDKWKSIDSSTPAAITPPSCSQRPSQNRNQCPEPVNDCPDGFQQIASKFPQTLDISTYPASNGKYYYYNKTGEFNSQWAICRAT